MSEKTQTGRTMAEATAAGDWFIVHQGEHKLEMPGCRGLAEALEATAVWGGHPSYKRAGIFQPGSIVTAERVLPGSTIGCMIVEDAGEHVLPAPKQPAPTQIVVRNGRGEVVATIPIPQGAGKKEMAS